MEDYMEDNSNGLLKKQITEKEITKKNGGMALLLILLSLLAEAALIVIGAVMYAQGIVGDGFLAIIICVATFASIASFIMMAGLHILNPNEALVLTLFGHYYGTLRKPGLYYTNPFCSKMIPANPNQTAATNQLEIGGRRTISTKTLTLNNEKQKVNDVLGNPIIIGAVVIWKVVDPTKAVFQVENYKQFLSIQCDSTIRNIARMYPYDIIDDDDTDGDGADEKTLRGSSQAIAEDLTKELQKRVEEAGLEILEVRITHLSYAEEIAASMLQRQQAVAIIAARKKIVEGAVSMVKMAIDQLGEEEIVTLDEERKAAMVSNLLVVLCGNKDAQPIVNSGSLY
jgi:regulator of protease activity HflC (stomatin/prohibitin superfamily)